MKQLLLMVSLFFIMIYREMMASQIYIICQVLSKNTVNYTLMCTAIYIQSYL